MDMLKELMRARRELPELLKLNLSEWNTKHVTYEYPHVQRLWRPFGDGMRVHLHIIESISPGLREKNNNIFPLYHTHPWPSAVMLLKGSYRMKLSQLNGRALNMVLTEGSSYEMTQPTDWHSVDPLDYEVMSLMVTGKPFADPIPGVTVPPQERLQPELAINLLEGFRALLRHHSSVGLYHLGGHE